MNKLSAIDAYDMVIFISTNAVVQCLKSMEAEKLKHKIIVSIGKKTAELLLKNGMQVNYSPERYFNSEALLAIDEFKKVVVNKNIAIIRGADGRDYLKNKLINLEAKVDYIDVYKSHCPQQNLDELKKLWEQNKLDTIVLTSASSTANFFKMATNEFWLNELTILIGSPRMQHEIPEGFKGKILIAEDPSDDTIFKKLKLEL